ncbi:MAG: type II secretion system protein [Parcubacteria group bacterium]|jgi:prepilin-type N-terminal cleavage/methylation domain-containing protein
MKNKNIKTVSLSGNKGFSLIEMLIVVTIIGIGLVGMVSFFNMNLSSQYEIKNEVVAAGLANEGLELMRHLKDARLGSGESWDDLASDWVGNCKTIDHWVTSPSVNTCYKTGSVVKTDVCQNATYKFYQQCNNALYSTGESGTDMKRTLSVAQGVADCPTCLKIICSVSWNSRATAATDILYPNNY